MLLVLIPTVWLALLALFAAICRVAADGDALQAPRERRGSESIGPRLVLSPQPSARLLPSTSSRRRRPTLSREPRRRRSTHGLH
jgi:hypothetical protein